MAGRERKTQDEDEQKREPGSQPLVENQHAGGHCGLCALFPRVRAVRIAGAAVGLISLVDGHAGAPALGVAGSAIATSISRWVLALALLLAGWHELGPRLRPWRPESFNRGVYWPVHFTSKVNQWQNVLVGVDTSPGYEPGCYIQGLGRIYIGDYTEIAPNVGIVSANHDPYDHSTHDTSQAVRIGSYCWIGMGAVILPGVELGDFTVVGAGAVITKPFPEGYVIIAGNPGRVIACLEPDRCIRYRHDHEYRGYIRADRFEQWKRWRLWV